MKCLYCGKEIRGKAATPHNRKFCDSKCRHKYNDLHRTDKPKPKVVMGFERDSRTQITDCILANLKLETRILSEMGLFTNEAL